MREENCWILKTFFRSAESSAARNFKAKPITRRSQELNIACTFLGRILHRVSGMKVLKFIDPNFTIILSDIASLNGMEIPWWKMNIFIKNYTSD